MSWVRRRTGAAHLPQHRGHGHPGVLGNSWPEVGEPTPDGGIAAPVAYHRDPGPELADDASVTEVLDLALRIGEVLLSSGTAAMDTTGYVLAVTGAYGLPRCEVDITFTSITISAHRGLSRPPVNTLRVVNYRSLDYTRLAEVDRLVVAAQRGELTATTAHTELDRITTAAHPYPRWVATAAWAGMAASVALLLGGGPLVIAVAFVATVTIDRTNRLLNRIGLPFFFQQVVGGFIATMPAVALYAAQGGLGISVRPSQVVAAGIVVLLSGLSLVGSVQDAITGALVTGTARFAEVMVLTAGIIVGLGLALKLSTGVGVALPPLAETSTGFTDLPVQVIGAAGTSAFFALASYAERRALLAAAAAGAVGWLVYGLLTQAGSGPVLASAAAATLVGLAGGVISRRTRIPPMVVTVSGIAPLLPALAVYRGLYGLTDDSVVQGFSELGGALAVAGALAAGVVLGEWVSLPVRTGLSRLEHRLDGGRDGS
ncbi:threonine/serine exporter family protein [Rhodococcus antarcticus]|uniref:Threonine/serine exporter family protein n=1 Tax=Rhodococcus antarcticus TaxID=2987751 RepID=A0ABY6NZD6_9NOCA|nr:threonine/serine exporter family protein [Rhodococcus antarcticus]UZJ24386.1 threonine/serine exporter family protein [Rhodococcus antarcticus]